MGLTWSYFTLFITQLMVNCWFGARWFGFRKDPLMKIALATLGVPLESQTIGAPNQQLSIPWESLGCQPGCQVATCFEAVKRGVMNGGSFVFP